MCIRDRYKIFHTKLVSKGLEVVIREELDNDQWKRYEIFQDTLGGRPYLFNGGLPPGGSDGSGTPGIDYQVDAQTRTGVQKISVSGVLYEKGTIGTWQKVSSCSNSSTTSTLSLIHI